MGGAELLEDKAMKQARAAPKKEFKQEQIRKTKAEQIRKDHDLAMSLDTFSVEPKLYKGKIRLGARWYKNGGINGLQIQDIFLPQPDLQVGDIIIGINGDSLLNKTNTQRIQLVIHHLK